MTPEAIFYKKIRESLPGCYVTRIESRVGLGIPDILLGLSSGKFVMLEVKVLLRGFKVLISPHQVAFHVKHARINCPVFVLIKKYVKTGPHGNGEIFLYRGADAASLQEIGIREVPLAHWPLDTVDWNRLRMLLDT
jgi:hypothetical protein